MRRPGADASTDMITLHTFGPAFGMPDPSPFVMKADILLQMAGVPYASKRTDVRKAPKGKLPYITDANGTVVADSTLIRFHLERHYGIDFDPGLSPAERATAWAFEKLCEDHLYWVAMRERWLVDANFDKGPRHFFDALPAPLRPIVIAKVRRDVRNALHGQGLGRHTASEMEEIAARTIQSIADFLADKPFLMGERPCGADAFVLPAIAHVLCDHFDTPSRDRAGLFPNLIAYRDRGMARWFARSFG